jgi:DNA mismatch repair protein MutS
MSQGLMEPVSVPAQTPMMQQYLAAKAEQPDAIVLFRMGDFYETFFQDAVEVSRLLELTLTSRNKGDPEPIPMAGVPHHAVGSYVRRLLDAGRKVAICEQLEDPKLAKGIVRRGVVRVLTPGVRLDDASLADRESNFLAALWRPGVAARTVGVVVSDISTGEVWGALANGMGELVDELARAEPAEVLVPADDPGLLELCARHLPRASLTRMPPQTVPEASLDPVEAAHAVLLRYVADTQREAAPPLRPLERHEATEGLRLPAETVHHLELLRTAREGERKGSLLHLLDATRTAMGARLLKAWLLRPLLDVRLIDGRLGAVEVLATDAVLRQTVRDALAQVNDLERLTTRVFAGSAGPRDLWALAGSLREVPGLGQRLSELPAALLAEIGRGLDPVPEVVDAIQGALLAEPPPTTKDGWFIRDGYDAALDELLQIAREGKTWFARYADELKRATGISSLKIGYHQVFGYYLEVTRPNLDLVPETWLRKQTLANCERFFTMELKEREDKVLSAEERRVALEQALFAALCREVARHAPRVQATAARLAELDVLASLAEQAARRGWSRPEIDASRALFIEGGRHPVLEALLAPGEFVPNDLALDPDTAELLMITGPNMAGKSTVMRQTALTVILAQMGSFVPASRARIGLTDQVFTRVGASDHLSRGHSTFMVEMTETAQILAQATPKSLIIIDEIGRGTSTYDGVSIAWAVAEHLHDQIRARTLFATHYHELVELAATRKRVRNLTIAVKEWQDEIVFLRRLVPGGTNRSYGIQVARLAGLPEPVLARAREVLASLEAQALAPDGRPRLGSHPRAPGDPWQLSLFAPRPPSALEEALRTVDPDALSPREALELVYRLRALLTAP